MSEESDSVDSHRDPYEFILDTQTTAYSNSKKQAERTLRVLIASIAVIVAFTRTSVYTTLYQTVIELEIPEQEIEVAGGAVTYSGEFYSQFGELNLWVGFLLAIISVILLTDSAIQSFRVLREDPVHPTQEYGDTTLALALRMDGIPQSMYQQWAKENSKKLERMNRRLQGSYSRILEASLVLLISIAILWSIYTGNGHMLAIFDWLLVAIGVGSIGLFVSRLLITVYSNRNNWKTEIRDEVTRWIEGESRSTPSAIAAYLIFSAYILIFIISLFTGIIWLKAVWIPEIISTL